MVLSLAAAAQIALAGEAWVRCPIPAPVDAVAGNRSENAGPELTLRDPTAGR
jgi:hypothetical protein